MKTQFKNEWIESEIITVSESVDKDEVFISDADTPNGWNDICILIKPDEAIKFANFIIEVANNILISKKVEDDDTPFTFKELEEKHRLPFCF